MVEPLTPAQAGALLILKEPLEAIARCLAQIEEHVRILARAYPILSEIVQATPTELRQNQHALNGQLHTVEQAIGEIAHLAIRIGIKPPGQNKGIDL